MNECRIITGDICILKENFVETMNAMQRLFSALDREMFTSTRWWTKDEQVRSCKNILDFFSELDIEFELSETTGDLISMEYSGPNPGFSTIFNQIAPFVEMGSVVEVELEYDMGVRYVFEGDLFAAQGQKVFNWEKLEPFTFGESIYR